MGYAGFHGLRKLSGYRSTQTPILLEAQLIDSPWVILCAYLCDSPPVTLGNLARSPNWARPSWEPLLPQIPHSSTCFSLGCGASLLAGSLFLYPRDLIQHLAQSKHVAWGFPSGSAGKESVSNAGDTGDLGLIPR